MILVDTSAWALHFNGDDDPCVERLQLALMREETLVTTPLIVTETLQGFKTDTGFTRARGLLARLPCLVLDLEGHVEAAVLYRRLRRRGVTVRGAVDCILAQTALHFGAEILARDRDFTQLARHVPLKLAR